MADGLLATRRPVAALKTNFIYSAISAGSAVLMLALLALAGRWLGVDDYGNFNYTIALAMVAEVFMDFGLHQVTVRGVAQAPGLAARYFHTSLLLKLAPGLGMIAVFGFGVLVVRPEPDVRLACLLMLGGAAMRSCILTAKGVLQGLERFGVDAVVTVADRVLLLVGCGLVLAAGGGLVATCATFLLVRIATGVFSLAAVSRIVGRDGGIDRELRRTLPREALPIGAFLLILNLYNRVDTLMLGSLATERETGLYGAAYTLYEGLTYAAAILSAVLVPRLSRLWTHDRVSYARLARRSLGGSALAAVLLAVLAYPLTPAALTAIFGTEFEEAATTVGILLLALPFMYVLWGLHSVALSSHSTRALLVVTAVGTGVNVVLNVFWIRAWGAAGAAAATVVSEVVTAALLTWSLREALAARRLATTTSE